MKIAFYSTDIPLLYKAIEVFKPLVLNNPKILEGVFSTQQFDTYTGDYIFKDITEDAEEWIINSIDRLNNNVIATVISGLDDFIRFENFDQIYFLDHPDKALADLIKLQPDSTDQTIYSESLKTCKKLNDEKDRLINESNIYKTQIDKLNAKLHLQEQQHIDEINNLITSFNADLTVLKRLNEINAKDYTHRQKRLLNNVFSDTVTEMFRLSKNPKDDLPF